MLMGDEHEQFAFVNLCRKGVFKRIFVCFGKGCFLKKEIFDFLTILGIYIL